MDVRNARVTERHLDANHCRPAKGRCDESDVRSTMRGKQQTDHGSHESSADGKDRAVATRGAQAPSPLFAHHHLTMTEARHETS